MMTSIALGIDVERDLVVSSHLRALSGNSIHRRSQSYPMSMNSHEIR